MDWFRAEVQKLLDVDKKPSAPADNQSATFKAGDVVKITGSTYYSGASIPAWVKAKNWIVKSVSGDRVVIDKSTDGKNSICSPVKASNLAIVTAAAPTPAPAPAPTPKPTGEIKVGDIVEFTGNTHYTSASAKSGVRCKPGRAKVTAVYPKGKYPYHLIRESGGGSTVYGWVDAADITGAKAPAPAPAPVPAATIKVGSKVKVKSGARTYTGGGLASFVYKTVYDVQQIKGDRVVIGLKGQVTAAVKLSDLILQ